MTISHDNMPSKSHLNVTKKASRQKASSSDLTTSIQNFAFKKINDHSTTHPKTASLVLEFQSTWAGPLTSSSSLFLEFQSTWTVLLIFSSFTLYGSRY